MRLTSEHVCSVFAQLVISVLLPMKIGEISRGDREIRQFSVVCKTGKPKLFIELCVCVVFTN